MKIIDINNFGAFMNPQITPYYISLLQKLSDDNIAKDMIVNKDNIILFKNNSQIYSDITTYICKNKGVFSKSDVIIDKTKLDKTKLDKTKLDRTKLDRTKLYDNKYLKYKQKYLKLQKSKTSQVINN